MAFSTGVRLLPLPVQTEIPTLASEELINRTNHCKRLPLASYTNQEWQGSSWHLAGLISVHFLWLNKRKNSSHKTGPDGYVPHSKMKMETAIARLTFLSLSATYSFNVQMRIRKPWMQFFVLIEKQFGKSMMLSGGLVK